MSSCFGFIFAPDHKAAAHELARVCRDRIGFTSWEPNPELGELYRSFGLDTPEGRLPFEWGKRAHVEGNLSQRFELEIERDVWFLEGDSSATMWDLWSQSSPPFKARVEELDPDRRKAFRTAYIEYCERYREGDVLRVPRSYLLVFGTKK